MSKLAERAKSQIKQSIHKKRIRSAFRSLTPTEFNYYPEPTSPGDYANGLRLVNGDIFHNDEVISLDGRSIWDLNYPSEYIAERLHAFDWMDDLAAVNTVEAHKKMKSWFSEWVERFGQGDGIGWDIEIVGWRLIRLITHATTILNGANGVQSERYFEALGVQTYYLKECLGEADYGLPKIVGIVAWLFASMSLDRFEADLEEIIELLEDTCAQLVEENEIFLYSRNPEELSQIFLLLVWADNVFEDQDMDTGKYQDQALDVIGRTVRAFRFGERGLLCAHGGGSGRSDEIDRALATAQIQGLQHEDYLLGFRHIRASQLNIFFDCAPPPSGKAYNRTHASTLGLWVAERDQVILGSGGSALRQPLSARIERQESMAHSTLVVAGRSSSELNLVKDLQKGYTKGAIIEKPSKVFDYDETEDHEKINIEATQDGYADDFGYNHERKLVFDRDGLFFGGLDILRAPSPAHEKRVYSILGKKRHTGIPVAIYFHLGPKIKASLDMNNEAVSFESEAGHLWMFRQEGGRIELNDSEYYHSDRLLPTPSQTIIVHTRLVDTSGYVSWSFQAFPKN